MSDSQRISRCVLRGLLLTTGLCLAAPGLALAQAAADSVELDEVRVTGGTGTATGYTASGNGAVTKTSAPLKETAASVSVVTAKRIEDQGVTTIAQALRYTAGVASEYRGASNMSDETYIRGFGYVPRFVDGMVVSGQGQQTDPWLLESVNVVKGPASLFFGQSSPGGVIDATTKKANGSTINRVGFATGSHSRLETRFDFARPVAGTDLSWRIVGLAAQADTQEKGLRTRRLTVAPSLEWRPSDATTVAVTASYQREPDAGYRNFRQWLGTAVPTVHGYIPKDFLVGDPDFELSTRTAKSLGYSIEHRFSDVLTLRHKARINQGDWYQRTLVWDGLRADERNVARSVTEGDSSSRQAVIDTHLEYKFNTGAARHTLVAGFDVQRTRSYSDSSYGAAVADIDWTNPVYGNVVVTGTPTGWSIGTTRIRQLGFYLQDQVTIGQLHLQAGLRYDKVNNRSYSTNQLTGATSSYDIDSSATTGRLGALYDWGNGLTTYASFSTSFEPVTTVPAAGQAAFKPTKGQQVEIGAKWVNADETLMVTASAYDLRQQNVLKRDSATNLSIQVGEIRSRGFELEAQGRVTDAFSVIGAYSYNDSRITKSTIAAEIGRKNDRVPVQQLSLWGKYEFASGFDAALGLRYIGKSYDRTNTIVVKPVTLVDLAIGYDFGKSNPRYEGLRAQLNVSNLADKHYAASCASALACFVGAGRTVTASLDYRW